MVVKMKESQQNKQTKKIAKTVSSISQYFIYVAVSMLMVCIAFTVEVLLRRYHPTIHSRLASYQEFIPRPIADSLGLMKMKIIQQSSKSNQNNVADVVNTKDEIAVEKNIPKGANAQGKPRDVSLKTCTDRHVQCVDFQRQGECENNPGWMIVNCPHSCKSCHLLDPKVRCDRDRLGIKKDHVYQPGDMNAMFESIEKTYGKRYGVTIHSRDPWVVTFDNFLTDIEVESLIESVEGNWERSTDTGSSNEFGETGRVLSQSRTSNNAWCRQRCNNDPNVQNIQRKIEEITWVPKNNYESFQVLRYEIGQKYSPHHDASPQQVKLSCGARILTFFLYLSDVDEGGETAFPGLNIAITPKKGKALLWPSTFSDDPNNIDQRTVHEARPVIRGTKFAANAWIHSHDYEYSNKMGCTGTFDELTQ